MRQDIARGTDLLQRAIVHLQRTRLAVQAADLVPDKAGKAFRQRDDGPAWKGEIPEGITKVFRCEGNFVFNAGRTKVDGVEDALDATA